MIINNFDVGILGLVCQLYRKDEFSQYNHECKLTILLASDISDGNYYPPQDITIYGKSAITKLRDELIKYFPLDDFIPPPVVEIKSPPTKVDITIKLPVKKYTFREFESPRKFDAFQIPNDLNLMLPDWLFPYNIGNAKSNSINTMYKTNSEESNATLTVNTLTGQKFAYIGDWILRSEEGDLLVCDDGDFERLFKEVS